MSGNDLPTSKTESLLRWLSQLENSWTIGGENPYASASNLILQLDQELTEAKRQRNDEQRLRLAAERRTVETSKPPCPVCKAEWELCMWHDQYCDYVPPAGEDGHCGGGLSQKANELPKGGRPSYELADDGRKETGETGNDRPAAPIPKSGDGCPVCKQGRIGPSGPFLRCGNCGWMYDPALSDKHRQPEKTTPVKACPLCSGIGIVTLMPDGHEVECGACHGTGSASPRTGEQK